MTKNLTFPKGVIPDITRLVQLANKYNCEVQTRAGQVVRLPIIQTPGKLCERCGAEFQQYRWHQKYCSKDCKLAAQHARVIAKWRGKSRPPGQRPQRLGEHRQCARCGTDFRLSYGNEKFCSDECRRLAKNANWVAKYSKNRSKRHGS